ncbi:Superoxide dismutase-like protein YojM [Tepidimonas sediminis]|uniref:Superoxide dismutase [Cu-Zn] n=1 Tax=Tepidimonas sediminis TaxID=2588941 RepID=A0A554WS96_9BURK|nr:superoxide dismutase family protein [Tepidimonas sediminis]TSE26449.1 Superoxide dismutase-like protein YojM [Tepidimonas sediminis]
MKGIAWAAAAGAAFLLSGCAHWTGGPTAVAQLQPTRGSTTQGVVQFQQRGDVVVVSGEVRGLKPNAEHGFHVHERGDCSSGDGMSAGGHYNPHGHPHGRHGHGMHHAGDLPNLKADAQGVATFRFEVRTISVGAGPADVVGRALIVHRDPDDYRSQPAGNAGPRLACAVIQLQR